MAENTSTLRRESFPKKAEEMTEQFDALAQKGKEKAEELVGKARQIGENATDMARNAGEKIQSVVENNPLQTALAALGIGVIVGALVTGIFRRQN